MKAKLTVFLLIFAFSITAFSQQVAFTRLPSSNREERILVTFPDYSLDSVNINDTVYHKLKMASCYPLERAGEPELLKCAFSLIVSAGKVSATIEKADFEVIDHINIAPSRGRLYRNISPETVPCRKGDSYRQNQFIEQEQLQVGEPYQLRDYRGMAITCMPFAYNPVSRQLKVYKSLIVSIKNEQSFTQKTARKNTVDFEHYYQHHFLNYELNSKSMPEQGEMLIIACDDFVEAVQPLAEWKNQRGISTAVVPLSEVGNNSASIRNYLLNYYSEHNLAWVILVGDAAQMPPYKIRDALCDNHYADLAGNDHYPDIMLGRISATTAEEVALQVQKFISYEENPPETGHFATFIGIASSEGPGDNNEYDFIHIRKIDSLLLSSTYQNGYELFDDYLGGLDAVGDPTAAQVITALDSGAGIINYCGHGDWDMFVTSSFTNNHIKQLNNVHKLPFIISVACVNGKYDMFSDCFAETWLKANKNGKPTGAVSALMSSINHPWNSPMCGQDEINRLLVNTDSNATCPSLGQAVFGGLIKMLDVYNDVETCHTWLLFGDPSLMMRTAIQKNIAAQHDTALLEGTVQCTVTSPNNGATAFLSAHNRLVAQAPVAGGQACLQFQEQLITDTLTLLITQFNHIPYKSKICFYKQSQIESKKERDKEEIMLAPVPATDYVILSADARPANAVTASLYEISGKKLWQEKITRTETYIDLTLYKPGFYFIKVSSEEKNIKTIKFIKQ
ncbi:MAG: C25 family cysteine peptidase [Bacteroidales bacterium]|jgi:gingipain R|nr:C25 family cysteine peptidase [Bacteroidales bacterium]